MACLATTTRTSQDVILQFIGRETSIRRCAILTQLKGISNEVKSLKTQLLWATMTSSVVGNSRSLDGLAEKKNRDLNASRGPHLLRLQNGDMLVPKDSFVKR